MFKHWLGEEFQIPFLMVFTFGLVGYLEGGSYFSENKTPVVVFGLFFLTSFVFEILLRRVQLSHFVHSWVARSYALVCCPLYLFFFGIVFLVAFYTAYGEVEVEDESSATAAAIVCFAVCASAWHIAFYQLPGIAHLITRLCLGRDRFSDFPRLIDYAYYFFGAMAVSFYLLEVNAVDLQDAGLRRGFLFVFIALISLRFTKASLELNKRKYLPDDVYVRSLTGLRLLPTERSR